ncbi:ATP-binding protein [Methanobrevibacter sp.]|uniref:ATP-binding protein n=1 Tax=Methanobrevibacter sp. TaxID=66852 RepID=UPI0038665F42
MKSINLTVDINELYKLTDFIHEIILKEDLKVDLIVEEVFTNIVNYSKTDFLTINVKYDKPTLTIEFIDNGIEFNPLLKKNPTLPNNIDEAHIGGLGIFLTKEMADKLDYQYINGENHLKIIKKIE